MRLRVFERGNMSAPNPLFPTSAEKRKIGIRKSELLYDIPGPVRGTIIDDEHVRVQAKLKNLGNEQADILSFVVGGYEH